MLVNSNILGLSKGEILQGLYNIFGKVGRNASEEVLFALIKTKCLPILFYGVEACPTNSSVRQSFEFTMNKILFKVFGAISKDSYRYIYECFGIDNDLPCAASLAGIQPVRPRAQRTSP